MRYIGDIHGNSWHYGNAISGQKQSIQVGDLGIGFVDWAKNLPTGHRFIRGNHDDPQLAAASSSFINSGAEGDHFFVNGGWSTDRVFRVEGRTWWANEEHTQAELEELVEAGARAGPRVVVTHEGPIEAVSALFDPNPFRPSRTSRALSELLSRHRPAVWIFGHWHRRGDVTIEGTRFICLEEGGWIDL